MDQSYLEKVLSFLITMALSFNICHIVWQKSRSFLLSCNHFIIVFNKLFWFCVNHSVMSMDCTPPGSSVHGILQARILAVGCYFLLQGIFPTQKSNPGLPHCRRTLQCLRHKGSPTLLLLNYKTTNSCLIITKSTEFSFLKKVDDKYATLQTLVDIYHLSWR